METDILENLGFTPAEANVYVVLLELGPVKVGRIIEKSGLQSSTVHNTVHSLTDKGFVTHILKGKMKTYQAADPQLLLKEFRERESKFESILPVLKLKQKHSSERSEAEIYEGTKGMMTMLHELIEDARQKDIYYFFAADQRGLNNEIQAFFERYDAKRSEKKLIVKGLANIALKPLFKKRRSLEMRYVPHAIPSNISICNGKMALLTWGGIPSGILIRSKAIISSQIDFFNEVWKTAKP